MIPTIHLTRFYLLGGDFSYTMACDINGELN